MRKAGLLGLQCGFVFEKEDFKISAKSCMEQSCGTGKNELLSVRCVRYSHCNNGATGAPGAIAAGTVDHWAAGWTQHLAPLGVTRSHRFEVFDVHSFSPKDSYINVCS